MTLILILVMILPFYYIPQFAWSQSQEPTQNNAYTTAKTEHVQVGDINVAYKRFGQGKPILFISGTSQTKDAWEPTLLSQLAATNHTLILHATYCGGNEAVYASGQAFESIMTLSSPQILRNMTSEQQAMILAQIMFPHEWLNQHPEILNTVIQLAPSRSASPEIIQQQGFASG